MPTVLGIDAAWTPVNPSGVAFVAKRGQVWNLEAVASSYKVFSKGTKADVTHVPNPAQLVNACLTLFGNKPDLIAVDMPLSRRPITARRASDDAVSRAYGARHCGTHTPSALRPGPISDELTVTSGMAGYPLVTTEIRLPGLIEVYPHPALVELFGAASRLPYKAGNVGKYWPGLTPLERRVRLFEQWAKIVRRLDQEIHGVAYALPALMEGASGAELKAYEDKLDAVICTWVGICAIEGRAIPFGDEDSAIWIPVGVSDQPS